MMAEPSETHTIKGSGEEGQEREREDNLAA